MNRFFRPIYHLFFILVLFTISFCIGLALSYPIYAATGINQIINFQGKVVNSDGTNVTDGTYDFVFTMYNGASSAASTLFTESWTSAALFSSTMSSAPGAAGESLTYSSNTNEATLKVGQILWNTTKGESVLITSVNTGTNVLGISPTTQAWAGSDTITNKIYVKDGVFHVNINSLNQDLSGVDFNSDSIFLGMNFNANGEMKPRIQYTSVPYAFNARKVAGLTVTDTTGTFTLANGKTLTVSNTLTFNGTDGTAFTFPSTSGTVVTNDSTSTLTNKTIGSTGLTFSGAGTDITTGTNEHFAIMPNGTGNVGIGTTLPLNKLQVVGNGTYAASFMSGNVGIGTTSPLQLFAVGTTSQFQVNSSGAITAATGITSSGTYTLSSLGSGLVKSTSGVLSVATAGVDYPAALSFTNGLTASSNTVTLGGTLTQSTTLVQGANNFNIAGGAGNVGIGTSSPAGKLHVVGNGTRSAIFETGNVGIGTTAPGEVLDIVGDLRLTNMRTRTVTRTLPTVVNDAVDIGSFAFSSGGGSMWISITVPSSSFSVAKQYIVPIAYNETSGAWNLVQPVSTTGPYSGNNFELEVNVNNGTASLRIRRSAGTTAGTAYVVIKQEGLNTDLFTASTTSAAVTAPTVIYSGTVIRQVGGNVGIGNTTPSAMLAVGAGNNFTVNSTGAITAATGITSSGTYTLSSLGTGVVKSTSGVLGLATSGTDFQAPLSFTNGLTLSSNTVTLGGTLTQATTITNAAFDMIYNLSSTGDFRIQDAGADVFAVMDTGNVGIGTTAPASKLHIVADNNTSTGFNLVGNNNGFFELNVQNTNSSSSASSDIVATANNGSSSTHYINMGINGSGGGSVPFTGANESYLYSIDDSLSIGALGASSLIKLYTTGGTSPVERFRITNTGNVGIGTTSPSSLLSVGSTSQFQVNSSGAVAAATGITSSGTITFSGLGSGLVKSTSGVLSNAVAGTDYSSPLSFTNGLTSASNTVSLGGTLTSNTTILQGAFNMNFVGTGNVGLGTSSPVAELHVVGNGTRAAIFDSGNVGIGTTNPGYKLDVGGTISTGGNGIADGAIRLDDNDAGAWFWLDNPSSSDYLRFSSGGTPGAFIHMVLNNNGNLGIGTTAPSASLAVGANAFTVNSSGAISAATGITSSGTITFSGLGSGLVKSTSGVLSNAVAGTDYSSPLSFTNGLTSASNTVSLGGTLTSNTTINQGAFNMNFVGSGNVGLGTSSPLAELHVVGNGTRAAFFESGNVGIGTTVSEAMLNVAGAIDVNDGNTHYYRNLASYDSNSSSVTGTMKITMPRTWSNTMMNIRIQGYNYGSTTGAWEVIISGYNYITTPAWINTSAEIRGKAPFNIVRLAHDGTTNVILLGNTSTVWNYPKVTVTEFIATFTNETGWGTGWSIAPIVDETGIAQINTPSIHTYLSTSGYFGIGTTSPSSLLSVGSTSQFQVNSSGAIAAATGITSSGSITFSGLGSGLVKSTSGVLSNAVAGTDYSSPLSFTNGLTAASNTVTLGGTLTQATTITNAGFDMIYNLSSTGDFRIQDGGIDTFAVMDSGNVGIGTTAPSTKLHVVGDARVTGALYDSSNSAGSSGYVLTSTGTGTAWSTVSSALSSSAFLQGGNSFGALATLGTNDNNSLGIRTSGVERVRVDTSGNVGIGKTNPSTKLDVYGDIRLSNVSNDNQGIYAYSAFLTHIFSLTRQATGGTTDLSISNYGGIGFRGGATSGPSTDYKLYLTSAGNVGIGTTAPGALLDLAGSNEIMRITDTSATGNPKFSLYQSTSERAFFQYQDADDYLDINVDAGIDFLTNNTQAMRLTTTGNLGIGTTNPFGLLTIGAANGAQTLNARFEVAEGDMALIRNTANPTFTILGNSWSGPATAYNAGTIAFKGNSAAGVRRDVSSLVSQMTTTSNNAEYGALIFNNMRNGTFTEDMRLTQGNLGIGTTAPASKLEVVGSAQITNGNLVLSDGTNYGIGTGPGQPLQLMAGGFSRMYITAGGNVGIGTTGPGTKFQINADDTYAGTGGQLYIAGSTNANKQLRIGYDTTGNYGYIRPIFVGSGESNLALTPSGGNVGIGTTSPAQKLDVNGTLRLTYNSSIYSELSQSGDTIADFAATGGALRFRAINANTEKTWYFQNYAGTDNNANFIRVANNESFSINMNNNTAGDDPDLGLQSYGSLRLSYDSNNDGNEVFTVVNNGTTTPVILADAAGNIGFSTLTASERLDIGGAGSNLTFSSATGPHQIKTGGSSHLALMPGGNLGIGTTSPTSYVDIVHSGTTTNGLNLAANSLTSGYAFNLSSTSTGLTTGSLMNVNWSPTAATTATGDLFVIGIGSSGNIGNILNVTDGGNSLFSVAENQITSAIPHAFTAAGDLSAAYDMIFTNQTASYIKSNGPLSIISGESFENNNLSLKTFGTGNVLFDLSGTGALQLQGKNSTLEFDTRTAGDTDYWMGIQDDAGADDDDKLMIGKGLNGGTNPYFVLNASGNVGVGTTSPNFKVSFVGTAASHILSITNLASTNASTTAVIRMNIGTATGASSTNARFVQFYAGATADNNGTAIGRIRQNNAAVAYDTSGADFAEYFDVPGTTEYGDIIATTVDGNKKALESYPILGVVSDTSGFVGNAKGENPNGTIVGLLGQVTTKVSTINGIIRKGDQITASTIAAVGKKMTQAGFTVGKALEDFDPSNGKGTVIACPPGSPAGITCGKINILVSPSWYDPQVFITGNGDLNGVSLKSASSANKVSETEGLVIAGNTTEAKDIIALLKTNAAAIKASNNFLTVYTDRLIAGLEVVTPHVSADTVSLNKIEALEGSDIALHLAQDGSFNVKNASGEAVIRFDQEGNAVFNGLVTAKGIKAGQIEGIDFINQKITALENVIATASAQNITPTPSPSSVDVLGVWDDPVIATDVATLSGLTVEHEATISGNLQVSGSSLIEGVLNVIHTITTNNFITTGWSDFMGSVIFRNKVIFTQTPSFGQDTGGNAVIKKGSDTITVTFKTEYEEVPVVNATIGFTNSTDTNEQIADEILAGDIRYIITKKSTKGFTIKLNKKATDDIEFSWMAIAVKDHPAIPGIESTPDSTAGESDATQSVSTSSSQLSTME